MSQFSNDTSPTSEPLLPGWVYGMLVGGAWMSPAIGLLALLFFGPNSGSSLLPGACVTSLLLLPLIAGGFHRSFGIGLAAFAWSMVSVLMTAFLFVLYRGT